MFSPFAAIGLRNLDIAIDVGTSSVRAATSAPAFFERCSVNCGRPALAGGVIVDQDAGVEVLRPILQQAKRSVCFSRLRALVCAPTDASAEEKARLAECVARAGVSAVLISPEPLAAAIGSGIDVASPYAKVIVDIGEGVTDCALIRSAQIVCSRAVRTGCSDLRQSLRNHFLQHCQIQITEQEAERVLRAIGVGEIAPETLLEVSGVRDGWPLKFEPNPGELQEALAPVKKEILDCIEALMRDLPPSLAAEVIEDGIFLSGGGALLRGIRDQVAHITRVGVRIVKDPLKAVLCGAGAMVATASSLRLWIGSPP